MRQFPVIREALALVSEPATRKAALAALGQVETTMEFLGVRVDQLNAMLPLDERGNPATQEYVDELLQRPRW